VTSAPRPVPELLRFAHALANPLRHKLLLEYHSAETSPSRAAKRLGAPVNLAAYHTGVLQREGLIELVRTEQVRGAREKYYRATVEPWIEDAEWALLPLSIRHKLTQTLLLMLWSEVRRAGMAGGFDAQETHLSRTPLEVDDQGLHELNSALKNLLETAVRIQQDSRARGGELTTARLVLMHFRL